jgi:uncharacterized protein (TIGR03435 family)
MRDANDMELVREYVRVNSEAAFAELVRRHINLVYSSALRHVGLAASAEEITQAVFIILARKAASLRPETILEGWLYETARLTALSFRRGERRRQLREQEAYMQSTLDENSAPGAVWQQLAPVLDEAMARLSQKDRDAVILRFFKDQSVREVAAALQVSEPAAQRRLQRALEKLRVRLVKRGVTLTATVIAGAVAANSVQAAPVALVQTISAIAVAKGAAAGTATLTLVKGALKIIAWTNAKTAIVVSVAAILAAGTTVVTIKEIKKKSDSWRNLINFYSASAMDADLDKTPPQITILPTIHPEWGAMWWFDRNGRRLGMNSSITNLLSDAYGVRNTHMVFSEPMPGGKYDFIANLPQGSEAVFQEKIKEQFGVVAHKAVIETDVWVLKAGDPDKLNASVSKKNSPHSELKYVDGKTIAVMEDESTAQLADALEGWLLQTPVADRTGLSGRYDLNLNWDYHDKPNSTTALIDQLHVAGFKLVISREPVEMLVVEKVK